MTQVRFITAIGAPPDNGGRRHVEGLSRHLDDQAHGGIDGLLGARAGTLPVK